MAGGREMGADHQNGSAVAEELSADRSKTIEENASGCTQENAFANLWAGLFKWSAALITLGGLALHLAGFIYHSEYAKAWGLDADLFPKSVEWILIQGYQVMLMGMVKLWVFFKTEWWKLAIWGLIIGTLVWGGVCALIYGKEKLPQQILRRTVKSWPKWALAGVFSYGYATFVCLSIAVSPIVVVTLIFLPALTAIEQAATDAQTRQAQYAQGCAKASAAYRCMILKRDAKPELQGFLIDSADSVLAIYLPTQNAVQIVPRDGLEIEIGLGGKATSKN